MKSRKYVSACFVIMVLAVLATSCSKNNGNNGKSGSKTEGSKTKTNGSKTGNQGASTKNKGVIGITCMDLGNPFFKLISDVMEEEAKKYGYTVLALGADNNAATQNTQIDDFIAQKCAAIFLNPVDSKALGQAVKKAHEAGIPVFTFDVQI